MSKPNIYDFIKEEKEQEFFDFIKSIDEKLETMEQTITSMLTGWSGSKMYSDDLTMLKSMRDTTQDITLADRLNDIIEDLELVE